MEQEAIPIAELISFFLYLGSLTLVLTACIQAYILYTRKNSFSYILFTLIGTKLLTIPCAFLLWAYWPFPFDVMFGAILLPILLIELIIIPISLFSLKNDNASEEA